MEVIVIGVDRYLAAQGVYIACFLAFLGIDDDGVLFADEQLRLAGILRCCCLVRRLGRRARLRRLVYHRLRRDAQMAVAGLLLWRGSALVRWLNRGWTWRGLLRGGGGILRSLVPGRLACH